MADAALARPSSTSATHEARRSGLALTVIANPPRADFYESCGFSVEGEAQTRFGPALRMSRYQQFSYFQCRRLPSVSHSIAVAMRLLPGRVLLRFRDPFEIVALRRGREAVERRFCLRRLGQRGREFGMQFRRGLWLMLGLARRRRFFRQLRGLADQGVEFVVGRQVVDRGELAELAHRAGLGEPSPNFLPAPEVERRMRFERGHDQQDLAVEREAGALHFIASSTSGTAA